MIYWAWDINLWLTNRSGSCKTVNISIPSTLTIWGWWWFLMHCISFEDYNTPTTTSLAGHVTFISNTGLSQTCFERPGKFVMKDIFLIKSISHLLRIIEVWQLLECERADDGQDWQESAGQEDGPGVPAQQQDVPDTQQLILIKSNFFLFS